MGLGISHVPEGRLVFSNLTVRENLLLGAYLRKDKEGIGGEQQMLAVGRAIMSAPNLMLLDEPSMGLSPKLVEELFEALITIRRQGTTLLLVEQNAHMALAIADRGYVLETGMVRLTGPAAELAQLDEVRAAYLG